MPNNVTFFLNGDPVTVNDPDPDYLLIDYLRSPEVGLTGAKKGCGQGGCGACTIILSQWNPEKREAEHRSINSCLRPVCALGGLSVTTIEGTGGVDHVSARHLNFAPTFSRGGVSLSKINPPDHWKEVREELEEHREHKIAKTEKLLKQANKVQAFAVRNPLEFENGKKKKKKKDEPHDEHEGMNPVAHRLAMNNGTQCGYCTVGFVMNMSAFLAANPKPTKKQIEDIFDGNICRCTGYRAILTGMKTFASDWSKEDEAERMDCISEDRCQEVLIKDHISIPFPKASIEQSKVVQIEKPGQQWISPENLNALKKILRKHGTDARMVFGNTSYGIYPEAFENAKVLVDLRLIKELYGIQRKSDLIEFGALTTYSELIDALAADVASGKIAENSRWGAIDFMARRTAGMIVRNAASIGGNSMLVFKHIFEQEPFPSDIVTALAGTGSEIEFLRISTGRTSRYTIRELVRNIRNRPELADDIILLRYYLPVGKKNEVTLAQKVALRQVNSHSIVNATTRIEVSKNMEVTDIDVVFGGIAPFPWHAARTERWLKGRRLSLDYFPRIARILRREVRSELHYWKDRMDGLPSEGFTDAYREELAVGFLYKAMVNTLNEKAPKSVPPPVRSSGEITWGHWPVSRGTQYYENRIWTSPVGQPIVKLMAFHQAMGQVHYTHEIELPPLGKNAAFVQSMRALAQFHYCLPGGKKEVHIHEVREHLAEKFSGFFELLTYRDIPKGGINLQGMGADQPLLAVDQVSYVGQVIAMVIADTEQEAIRIAAYASKNCIGYHPVKLPKKWAPDWTKPILSIDEAIKQGSIFPDAPKSAPFMTHIWKVTRPGSQFDWMTAGKDPLDKKPDSHRRKVDNNRVRVIENTQVSGCQVHFYMETQSCVAYPEDGNRIVIHPSSQSPTAMHQTSAMAIGFEHNRVEIAIRQLGGGYGGKTEQARFIAGPTAIAAIVLNRPIRLIMKREQDTAMIGKRHAYYGQYQIAIDDGFSQKDDRGLIRGINMKFWGDGGAFYDCSFIVSNCIQLRTDNAYNIRNFESQLDVCRTNTAPNTAMRAFGDIQGKLILENAIDDAAFSINMEPYQVRLKNMYRQGDVTPFGQALSYCYMRDVWEYTLEKSDYDNKVKAVKEFNDNNRWRKRGVYMVPVKYGSGYNLVMIEQAAAMVSIYSGDGSIVINQGGVDMGQGVITQIEQVASYILNVPMELIQVLSARTSVIPNPTSTGGSTGTAYNGEAVRQVCEVMRQRLLNFGYDLLKEHGDQWCRDQGVDFWNHQQEGWAASVKKKGADHENLIWQNLVALAFQYRVELVATFNAKIPGGTTPVPVMTFKSPDEQPEVPGIPLSNPPAISGEVDSFYGFTFSAACAMVEVDILTGETKILSADLVYDMGWSLNPALDIGQVEGAFMQGVGYIMTEKLVLEPEGEEQGRLNTLNTWRYKPPAITTIPLELNTYLYPRDRSSEIPENPNGLISSKEIGEPPLVLATSVFFAIKDAIRSSRVERKKSGLFRFDAPATVQEVRRALEVEDRHF
ncbi:molybdopterin cofactor-binding domain-containing protein [Flavilitoribacter nigricans]|uniref:Xanthine dehydrogenase n=1 Tax=Flavilitoribacter nigricans (strain ATCC 23147 / DSM 23189 / NBRC 102662 / NCIMB 1420 / SS-2) TaxID=1122177 RepID=A0A2D0N5I9_FLAN2|nr:molybdopterin cofactor-binding domain-containing protein [Flavilitoribacter nigricans]PHN03658.1 xanthine dehydrogenase [Flavilitoribacter nigricans DSM 23189 = NBRC 102662]